MALFDFLKRSAPPPAPAPTPPPLPTPTPQRRRATTAVRMLQAGAQTRLEASWGDTPTTADAIVYRHWSVVCARSREQAENNDHARKFMSLLRDNVAGPDGFRLQAQPRDPNGTIDKTAADAIEDAYELQSEKGNFDVTGTMSRADVERLAIETVAKDGEILAILRYGEEAGPTGFAVQLMDPMLLDPQQFEKLPNGNHIRHGIEFTPSGRPVAYYFREMDEQQMGYTLWSRGAKSYNRIEARHVVHAFLPQIVGQKRGLGWMRTALWRMRMLGGFEDAAVTKARTGAAVGGFFTDPEGEDNDETDLPLEAEPGVFHDIGSRQFVGWNPQFPDQAFDPFVKAMLRSIASGLNVSYNNLASDLTSVNFSSIRQGALDEREVWKGLQSWFAKSFCLPIFRAWVDYAVLAGQIRTPGGALRIDRVAKYRAAVFRGRRWAWIDPGSEVIANERAVAAGFKSRRSIIREQGDDHDEVEEEMKGEREEAKKMGLTFAQPAGTPLPPTSEAGAQDQKPANE